VNQQNTADYVGIDLSLTATGIAVWDGERLTVHTVKSRPDDGTIDGFLARCERIARDIVEITKPTPETRFAIEGLSMHSKSSSLDKTFGSWWLVLAALAAGNSFAVITPSQRAKYATGKGNASKDEVMLAAARRYPDAEISNNNEADAVVILAMLARHYDHPIELSIPAANLTALEKVRWAA
jgi:Holliday junction resolvasome RuvABC endonuclease subunit